MTQPSGTLRAVVGDSVYEVWLNMLQELVPWGRTHRLAPMVAGMLRYATSMAEQTDEIDTEGSVAWRLIEASETPDPAEAEELLLDLVVTMFKDANVDSERTNARGMPYSVAENAIEEYVCWEYMPWE